VLPCGLCVCGMRDGGVGLTQVRMFADAIEDDYYFEMFVEDLPMWGYIGEVEGEELLLGHLETAHR